MRIAHLGFVLDDAIERFDFQVVRGWLSGSYWSPGITQREVAYGFQNSTLVIGTYRNGAQIGCLRLASDRTRFAYVMDVFVDPAWRGRGLARRMLQAALEHPDTKLVYQWMLATHDAHGVYSPLGFAPLPHPERVMAFRRERDWLPEVDGRPITSAKSSP